MPVSPYKRQMVLWTTIVQVVVVGVRIVVYPVALCLSWGYSFVKAINISSWYSGSGIQMIFLVLASIVFTVLIPLCAIASGRRKKRTMGSKIPVERLLCFNSDCQPPAF